MIPNLANLIDPRPRDGNRLAYCGMTMLPIAFECEWMQYNEVLQVALVKELWELLRNEALGLCVSHGHIKGSRPQFECE
ncbi:hypothetical protein H7849_19775 [Alloacidobacterium dinghuense]|uniref:Uncharacterized protein n=1 Tax=Alloacidobacterium dinghuense TaxID=2763107 RepID=A0A7G8BFI8_9BACT|nr:hypothetical protein [Alloacidobacterium dinghuense]QNI31308.1 hypothetical protein H7849_19775 [Alloacidobacterium dinghuense]